MRTITFTMPIQFTVKTDLTAEQVIAFMQKGGEDIEVDLTVYYEDKDEHLRISAETAIPSKLELVSEEPYDVVYIGHRLFERDDKTLAEVNARLSADFEALYSAVNMSNRNIVRRKDGEYVELNSRGGFVVTESVTREPVEMPKKSKSKR